jgi:hypothetical protein
MTLWLAFWHVMNVVGPIACVGVLLTVAERWVVRRRQSAPRWSGAVFSYALVGLLVWGLGLVLWGRDGKMSTYTAMVLAWGALAALRTRGTDRG